MKESPIFAHLKATGKHSTRPLVEAFTKWENLKRVLITLLGATAGQGVIWYTGQFYALFYLQSVLKIEKTTAFVLVAIALLLSMPFFTFFGALSDRIGRKKLMMTACLLAVVSYIPIYHGLHYAAGNEIDHVTSITNKVTGEIKLTPMTADLDAVTHQPIADKWVPAKEASSPNKFLIVLFVWLQVILVCMIYGPIAAYLVEAFPARIRYTSMSLPYHIGNGIFGGLLPLIGLSLCATTGNIYAGLYYPMIVAGLTFVLGMFLLKESRGVKIWDEVIVDEKIG
jgi:MFS family permease